MQRLPREVYGALRHGDGAVAHSGSQTGYADITCSIRGKNGVSAHEIHRHLGVTYKSAWFIPIACVRQ